VSWTTVALLVFLFLFLLVVKELLSDDIRVVFSGQRHRVILVTHDHDTPYDAGLMRVVLQSHLTNNNNNNNNDNSSSNRESAFLSVRRSRHGSSIWRGAMGESRV
jgi:hypothetical protein